MPQSLTAVSINDTTVLVDWEPPSEARGVISQYELTYFNADTIQSSPNAARLSARSNGHSTLSLRNVAIIIVTL
jgi:hypothetical protein